jgi:acetyl-CoA carboxylase/biotin carboxylase 1
VILGRFPSATLFHTFRLRHRFAEDLLYRNFVPELGFLLELRRLDRYELELCNTESPRVLVYSALERLPSGSTRSPATRERRLFVRSFVNLDELQGLDASSELDWSRSAFGHYYVKHHAEIEARMKKVAPNTKLLWRMLQEVESVFVESLNVLEHTLMERRQTPSATNSVFIAVMSRLAVDKKLVAATMSFFMTLFGDRISALNVHLLELVLTTPAKADTHKHESQRFVITNYSGHLWRLMSTSESVSLPLGVPSPRVRLRSSRLDDIASSESQYVPNANVSSRRRHCKLLHTTYVYDLLDVLERALIKAWSEHEGRTPNAKRPSGDGMTVTELRLDGKDVMRPLLQPGVPGGNDVGMVAWRIAICTPEYPQGRELILIANDVSFEGGSFGPREDALFKQASQLARELGVPRVYVSANAGARIGLADELLRHFRVAWKDASDPSKGFEYLYLDRETAAKMSKSVKVRAVEGHPDRMEITDVIGEQHGIGVENLQGSGLIAGETSLAYKETFTLTIVTGRSVGIGAYITRLGQRVIQNQGPILLTGYDALNRLLGREIYISNTQMGGPAIMYRNGVSHVDVTSDLQAFSSMLSWLAFVPRARNEPLPALASADPLARSVDWHPQPSISYDPRMLLNGSVEGGAWRSGFFDRDSFVETLGGWARTVVTGRARLGGIPVGVIAVETRTVQKAVPADPASDDSRELVSQQAGQVWYPDSAYKTAQAIWDFNHGEQLPMFIFANWRGFSGGVSDMFNEVLKFGSMIVDALSEFKQPVFVYLPPFAELRGGSWAVIDPFVNPAGMMEMYTSESAQGGILEATGTVSIKFRRREQLAAMVRLDPTVQSLTAKKETLSKLGRKDEAAQAVRELEERTEQLSKVYHTIALRFCELHDTPGRMLEKKVVSGIVPWKDSRLFFGHRLRRRVLECRLFKDYASRAEAETALLEGFTGNRDSDAEVADFLAALEPSKRGGASEAVRAAAAEINASSESAIAALLNQLTPEAREALKKSLH